MILKTNDQEVTLLSFVPRPQTVFIETVEPVEMGDCLEVWTTLPGEAGETDQPFLIATYLTQDWLRVVQEGNKTTLTQIPEPIDPPEEPEPQPDELTMTQLAVAELATVVEEINTANQLAIAELAEALLGGEG